MYETGQHYLKYNFDGDLQFESMRQALLGGAMTPETEDIDTWLRRLNLPMEGQPPDLADANAIDALEEAARLHFEASPAVAELAYSMIATLFYFELRDTPSYEDGYYTCYGRILCRLSVEDAGFSALMERLDASGARFVVCGRTLPSVKSRFVSLDRSGNFCKPVRVQVQKLSEPLDMRIRLSKAHILNISASHTSVASFITLQRLDWPGRWFGQSRQRLCHKRRVPSTNSARPAKRNRTT